MQDFFKQQAEWLKTWQEQQQNLTKQYAAWGEGLAQGAPGDFSQQVPGNFEELVKAQQELFEQFTGFGQQMQQNLQQLWGDKLPSELLRQFNFNLLQEFYKNWLGNMKFPGGMSNPFMPGQNWTDLADERLEGRLVMWLPGDVMSGAVLLGMADALGLDYSVPALHRAT